MFYVGNIGRSTDHPFGGTGGRLLVQFAVALPVCGVAVFSAIARTREDLKLQLFGLEAKNVSSVEALRSFILPPEGIGDIENWRAEGYAKYADRLLQSINTRCRTCDGFPLTWFQHVRVP